MALPGSAQQESGTSATAPMSYASSMASAPRGRTRRRSYSDSEGSDAAGPYMQAPPGALQREQSKDSPNFREVLNKKFPVANSTPRSRDDDITALIDFLNNQPPPPSNRMSVPFDDDSSAGRGKWDKLKMIGKRSKSVPKPQPQPQIRLPDTAVSGKTTGGHRHIAISIPMEASPFGLVTRTQYPVIPPQHNTASSRSHSPAVRTFINERGVVSVLRAVDEDDGTSSGLGPASPASFRSQPTVAGTRLRASPRTKSPHVAFNKPQPDSTRTHHSRGIPSPSESYLADVDSMFPDTIEEEEQDASGSDVLPPKSPRRSAYPSRFSNTVYGRGPQMPGSIDGIISQRPSRGQSPLHNQESRNRRASSSASANENLTSQSHKIDAASEVLLSEPVSSSSLVDQGDGLAPTAARKKNRRDIVKDRKKRDMEAMRSAKQAQLQATRDGEQPAASGQDGKETLGNPEALRKPSSNITLSPVMVVIDEDPSCPETQSWSESAHVVALQPTRSKNETKDSLVSFEETGHPTPPHSNQGSPPQKHTNLDRTALARRREWNAHRERERKAREGKPTGPTKIGRLNMGSVSLEPIRSAAADKDVLRLLDTHREYRLYEMERRLERLERNGDVWLRALLPLVESANHSLPGGVRGRDDHGWTSDEELDEAVRERGKGLHWDKFDFDADEARRRPLTVGSGDMLGGMVGRSATRGLDSWAEEDGYRRDWSGLASLEPLMRELSRDTQLRPGTA